MEQYLDMIEKGFVLYQKDGDFFIEYYGQKKRRLYNCKDVSKAFIKEIYEEEKEFMLEDGVQNDDYKEIDIRVLLDEAITEGWWYWRKQVKQYVGHKDWVDISY